MRGVKVVSVAGSEWRKGEESSDDECDDNSKENV